MRCVRRFVFLCALPLLMAGCGGSAGSGGSAPVYPDLTGNWNINIISNLSGIVDRNFVVGGYISNTEGSVSGILHVTGSNCYTAATDIPITGAITTKSVLSISSAPVAGQILTVTGIAVVTPSGNGAIGGTYTIAGGCAGGDNGMVIGILQPPFTNTYTGSMTLGLSNSSIAMTMTTVQSGPDADGEYSVTGSATFGGTACFTKGTITSSAIFGGEIQVSITTDNNGSVQFTGMANPNPDGISILASIKATSGSCAGQIGIGILSAP